MSPAQTVTDPETVEATLKVLELAFPAIRDLSPERQQLAVDVFWYGKWADEPAAPPITEEGE